MIFLEAYFLTLVIETAILYLLLRKSQKTTDILKNSFAANTLTHPIVWFVFPLLGLSYPLQLAFSELFAFLFEAWVYATLFKMKSRDAVFVSFTCNTISFLSGLLIQSVF